jgi:phosphatidylinositol alpha-1,6-mannosyltransferase
MIDIPVVLSVLASVARVVWQEGIEVVCIGELTYCGWLILPCKYLLGLKTMVYVHGEEIMTFARSYAERAKFPLLRTADAVIAVSDFTRKVLEERAEVNPAKIHVLLNGVDTDIFYPAPRRSDLIEQYGLGGRQVMLSVGRLVERKGVDNAIRALAAVRLRFPNIRYLIVGDGPYRTTLEKIAVEAGVVDNVIFAGIIVEEDLAAHYALCDIFVQPNRELEDGDTEGFGLVFLEANACGKPVVAGNAGGAVSAVNDGQNGLLVDGRQVSAISEAVIRLLDDQVLYEQLRNGGLVRAAQSNWKRHAGEFVEICKSLKI